MTKIPMRNTMHFSYNNDLNGTLDRIKKKTKQNLFFLSPNASDTLHFAYRLRRDFSDTLK